MAGCRHRRPVAAYPRDCRPGTGCAASCGRSGAESATPCGWRRWNRCSARSSRAGASGSFCCGAWRRSAGNGCSSAPATTCSSSSALGKGSPARPDPQALPETTGIGTGLQPAGYSDYCQRTLVRPAQGWLPSAGPNSFLASQPFLGQAASFYCTHFCISEVYPNRSRDRKA